MSYRDVDDIFNRIADELSEMPNYSPEYMNIFIVSGRESILQQVSLGNWFSVLDSSHARGIVLMRMEVSGDIRAEAVHHIFL
ncbi:MAG: hypothetical protein R2688_05865 [Fimbriimonadaceae bacterium]